MSTGGSDRSGRSAPPWHEQLRRRGYRLTPQRQLVLEAVGRRPHTTPEEILAEVRTVAGTVNSSTVYRTLELLEQLGLVQHSHLGHGAPTYSVTSENAHVHLVCQGCGAVAEVQPAVVGDLVDRLAAEEHFTVDVGHLTVFGRCADCG